MSLEVGKPIVFKDVLLVSDGKKVEVGAPFVKGVSVKGKVHGHPKGKKITVFKYKPKQRYRRTQGHRQLLTHIEIESVGLPAAPKKKAETKSKSSTSKSKKTGGKSKSSASTAAASSEKSTSSATKKSASASEKKSTSKPKAKKKD